MPFDLTPKNKALLRQLESDRLRAKLYFLPEQLMGEVAKDLENGRVRFVEAQVAIAIDILLALPLRPQNLSSLSWRHHFSEPNGPRSQLLIHIAARETKTKRQDIVSEVPDEVARRLRWYRRHILPRLGADVNGHLFVTEKGSRKSQATLTVQIIDAIARHIGIHMTPHQFRHFGATSYLEEHPEDFETARAMLGHAWSKTTRIYAGSSSRRASRAYNQHLFKQREALKLMRSRRKRRRLKTMRTLKHLPSTSGLRPTARPSAPPMSLETSSTRPLDRALTLQKGRATCDQVCLSAVAWLPQDELS